MARLPAVQVPAHSYKYKAARHRTGSPLTGRLPRPGAAATLRPVRFVPHPVSDGDTARAELLAQVGHDDDVFLLDFCGKPGLLQALCGRAAAVHLLDHHKTAQGVLDAWRTSLGGDLPANLEVVLDLARSGARIAYDYFGLARALRRPPNVLHIVAACAQTAPHLEPLVDYIQDNDLWRHALDRSREFSAGFDALKLDLDVRTNPGLFATIAGLSVGHVQARGVESLQAREAYVAATLPTAYPVRIPGGAAAGTLTCLAVTVREEDAGHRSELGNQLALRSRAQFGPDGAVGAVVYPYPGGPDPPAEDAVWKVSLRAAPGQGDGDGVDTTVFSQHYGGGGHRAASAFTVPGSVLATFRMK